MLAARRLQAPGALGKIRAASEPSNNLIDNLENLISKLSGSFNMFDP